MKRQIKGLMVAYPEFTIKPYKLTDYLFILSANKLFYLNKNFSYGCVCTINIHNNACCFGVSPLSVNRDPDGLVHFQRLCGCWLVLVNFDLWKWVWNTAIPWIRTQLQCSGDSYIFVSMRRLCDPVRSVRLIRLPSVRGQPEHIMQLKDIAAKWTEKTLVRRMSQQRSQRLRDWALTPEKLQWLLHSLTQTAVSSQTWSRKYQCSPVHQGSSYLFWRNFRKG